MKNAMLLVFVSLIFHANGKIIELPNKVAENIKGRGCFPNCSDNKPCSPNYADPCWSFNTFNGKCNFKEVNMVVVVFDSCLPDPAIDGATNSDSTYTACNLRDMTATKSCNEGGPSFAPCGNLSTNICNPPDSSDIAMKSCRKTCSLFNDESPADHSNCNNNGS